MRFLFDRNQQGRPRPDMLAEAEVMPPRQSNGYLVLPVAISLPDAYVSGLCLKG
jgi:hypothetical protein